MASQNLYEASHQWATRPDDERFANLSDMLTATLAHKTSAVQQHADLHSLKVVPGAYDLALTGTTGREARLTHYSFGQFAQRVGAPAAYLRTLPTGLAADALNYGISKAEDRPLNLLFHKNGGLVLRAATTERYDRVWNASVVQAIQSNLVPQGWVVPPGRPVRPGQPGSRQATQEDVLQRSAHASLGIKVGDWIAPSGLYASDHDMFAFLVNENKTVTDGKDVLFRGAFVKNSEVGDGALWFTLFLYKSVCGNHIVWDASQVTRVRIAHKKASHLRSGRTLASAVGAWQETLKALPPVSLLETQIANARKTTLGQDEEETVDAVYKFSKSRNLSRLTMGALTDAYATAERKVQHYGSPRTVWGMVNGLTELSQTDGYTDARTEMDMQAGRLMEMAQA